MHRTQEDFLTRGEPGPTLSRRQVDVTRLEADLRKTVRGDVHFDAGARALYATDASNFRQIPIGVVRPVDADDVAAAIDACRRHGAPVLARGAGTSLAGQCCNVAVVLDFSKHMNRILEIDPVGRTARVQPGVILDHLRAAARAHGLTVGPDPATHTHCTIGGMIGNDACGPHSHVSGRMVDNVHALEVVSYRGERMRLGAYDEAELERIVAGGGHEGELFRGLRDLRDAWADEIRDRLPRIPRRASGYNLDELLPERGFHVARSLVGSEGTCVTVVEATVRLVPEPAARVLLVLGFTDVFEAAAHVPTVIDSGPIGLEGMDRQLIDDTRGRQLHDDDLPALPDGGGFLVVEYGGDSRQEARAEADALRERLHLVGALVDDALYLDPADQEAIWRIREAGLAATARVPGRGDAWPGWEDSVVPPEQLADYLRDLQTLLHRYGYTASIHGHFGQGCVHCRIDFDLQSAEGVEQYRQFLEDAARLCVSYGGSLSGGHGDGQQRGELLPILYGDDLVEVMRRFKYLWDPDRGMNPGKLVDGLRLDEDLRLGADHAPLDPRTHFRYPHDDGKLSRAALRCVGVGRCRREEGGTMCPSYKATREEKHSTRGRAHLLWEMLQPESPIVDGFRSTEVLEALELCLACKGCKRECPVNVDVANYKAEFYAHHYRGTLRPRQAYTMCNIWWWARIASFAPRLANVAMQDPRVSRLTKWAADVHPARGLPAFADETFKSWYRRHERPNLGARRVLLWADTWTNYFRPEVGQAAVEVLEAAGFDVIVLQQELCCGRPLYEFGRLEKAERLLEQCITATRPFVEQGIPVVVLEPSCASVFRDELIERLPDRDDARALFEGTFTFAELMERHAPDLRPTLRDREVLVHGHCHQKAIWGTRSERRVLREMRVALEMLDTGCCGMAGSFGYQRSKYDVSVAIGEQDLLPIVRRAAPDALVVSDGFSCRCQIEDTTQRRGVHLAQVMQLALREREPPRTQPETAINRPGDRAGGGAFAGLGQVLTTLLAVSLGWTLFNRARRE